MKTKVLQALKPKIASLGFNKEEIENIASQVAGNLTEDADEEKINAQVDAVIPYLKVSQSAVNRIVNAKRKPEENTEPPKVSTTTETKEGEEPTDKFEKLLKVIEAQNAKIDALVNKDLSTSRRSVYESKLKELPEAERKSRLRLFERMSFTDDDDFSTFIEETEAEIPELVKEYSEMEVSGMGKPIRGGKSTDKQATDEEVKDVLSQLNI